jgi:hypothetical protein
MRAATDRSMTYASLIRPCRLTAHWQSILTTRWLRAMQNESSYRRRFDRVASIISDRDVEADVPSG